MRYTNVVIAAFLALASHVTSAPIEAREPRGSTPLSFLSNDNNNGFVFGSGNGGNGGINVAKPVAISSASTKGGKIVFSKVFTNSAAGNEVIQDASGGDGYAVGTFGQGNKFYERGYRPSTPVAPAANFLSGNDNNGIVVGSGNGGAGGINIAKPVAISGAFTKGGKIVFSKVSTNSEAGNGVYQDASGGDGYAVGTFGQGNKFYEKRTGSSRKGSPVYVAPDISVLSDNDNNGAVLFSGNGGAGGVNIALPIALSGAKSGGGQILGSKIITGSSAINSVSQDASGGDGYAVGTFGSNNKFHNRDEGEVSA